MLLCHETTYKVLVVDEIHPVQQNALSYLSSEVSAESEALELHNLLPTPLHTLFQNKEMINGVMR